MDCMKISVRRLVEFILREGDIDNRRGTGSKEEAMQAGSRLHRKLQKGAGASYRAEVPLAIDIKDADFVLHVEGRADGVMEEEDGITIDEIKGMYQNVMKLENPYPIHEAQAKCYAYMYAVSEGLTQITVRMTYCNLETEKIRYFYQTYEMESLKQWFLDLMEQYLVWARWQHQHKKQCLETIRPMEFPYAYRKGQRDMVVSAYAAITRKENLFVQAPTGIGKTMATIFPSVKAIGEGHGEKIFYLTAKTSLAGVAMQAFDVLREQGLQFQTICITAKEKLCFMEETDCNPDVCPYAKGHYDRVNQAIYDMIRHENRIDRELIIQYAEKHQVCPFEYSLDVSLFVDGIICDYNYVFDPRVNLKRYFAEGVRGDYIFLVDEAHNLVDRASNMYSATLFKEDIVHVRHILSEDYKLSMTKCGRRSKKEKTFPKQLSMFTGDDGSGEPDQTEPLALNGRDRQDEVLEKQKKLISALGKCNQMMLEYRRVCETYQVLENIEPFALRLTVLEMAFENYLEAAKQLPGQDEVLMLYFDLLHFNNMYRSLDDGTVIYCEQQTNKSFFVKLYCIDPAVHLSTCLDRARATIFFSATMLPIHYYKELLGNRQEDKAIYIESPFARENRRILIGTDVSSRYKRRGRREYIRYCEYITAVCTEKPGNYMVFFPSYQMLGDVYEIAAELGLADRVEIICQSSNMKEEERQAFLKRFTENTNVVAFCILGGIFSEGIDLVNDSLIGVFVIGTGLPMLCNEREIMQRYFDAKGRNGFDYAYRYPGMNKVEQAAGRVIRTEEDKGLIFLLDDRFYTRDTIRLFPTEWADYEVIDRMDAAQITSGFWSQTTLSDNV